jgi:hypothetical protein
MEFVADIVAEIRKISSARKDLRAFALVMGVACALISALLVARHRHSWTILAAAAATILILGFTFPAALLPLQKVWMAGAIVIGWFASRIVLAALYYIAFTGIGFFGRRLGKAFLEITIDKGAATYWKSRPAGRKASSSYDKQY